MHRPVQKLYCYVDETGQDTGSKVFVVVSIVDSEHQDKLRASLIDLEYKAKLGAKKWHTSRSPEKEDFLEAFMKSGAAKGGIYYGSFKKPLTFFAPLLEVVEKSIKDKAGESAYQCIVYVDGIDKKKALELTNALRLKGMKLKYVRSARDESEPIIRLADRWAGCIRDALEGKKQSKSIFNKATRHGDIKLI